MIIKVEVTKEDIKKGLGGECNRCPIALAVGRLLDTSNVSVHSRSISLYVNGERKFGYLPELAMNFIYDFDGHKAVQPFSFEIELQKW